MHGASWLADGLGRRVWRNVQLFHIYEQSRLRYDAVQDDSGLVCPQACANPVSHRGRGSLRLVRADTVARVATGTPPSYDLLDRLEDCMPTQAGDLTSSQVFFPCWRRSPSAIFSVGGPSRPLSLGLGFRDWAILVLTRSCR